MNLLDLIQQGESKTLELKSRLPQHDQLAKTIVAFANTSGGKLVLGVDDQRNVVGVAEDDLFTLQDQITSIIHDRCSPFILPEIYTANLQGKMVLVVEVFRGNLPPYYLKSEGKNNGAYLRIGASNRKADFDHVLELERQRRNQSFDEEICREQTLQTLDLGPLERRFAALGKPLDQEKLKNLKLIQQEQGTTWPTQGLLILLGLQPHVVTKCARFKGTDMSVFLDRKEYTGDLITQLEQAEAFIKNHIHLRGEIKGNAPTPTKFPKPPCAKHSPTPSSTATTQTRGATSKSASTTTSSTSSPLAACPTPSPWKRCWMDARKSATASSPAYSRNSVTSNSGAAASSASRAHAWQQA